MNRIEWIFELFDRVSPPARRISRSFADVGRAVRLASGESRTAHVLMRSDTLNSVRSIGRLSDAVSGLGVRRGFDALRDGAASSAASVRSLTNSVLSLRNLLIGGLAAGGVGFAAKGLIDQVGFIEQQRIALSTLLKSPIRGEAALEWSIRFADITPFETTDVLESTRLSMAMGFQTNQIEKLLTTLGNTAAGTGSRLSDLIRIFGQMKAAGKLEAGDLSQLAERGIGVWQYLAEGLGKTIPEVRKLVEQGMVDSATGMRIIFERLQKDFGGLMEAQSKTIFGLASTLRSRPQLIAFELERDRVLEPFRKVLINLVELTDFSKPPGSDIGKRLKEGLGTAFKVAFEPLARLTQPKTAMGYIQAFVDGVVQGAGGLVKVWPVVKGAVGEFVEGVKSGFKALLAAWDTVKPVADWLGRLAGGFTGANTAAGQTSGFVRLLGFVAALAGAWRVLNILTLGGAGILGRFILMASRAILVRVGVLGLEAIGAAIARMGGLRAITMQVGALIMRLGTFLRMGWLVGMGPVGWVIAGITAVGGALIALYNRSQSFRDGVNAVWRSISTVVRSVWEGVVALFSSLPERVVQAVRKAGPAFVEALKAVVRSAPGGDLLLKGLEATAGFVRGAVQVGAQVGGALVQGAKDILGIKSPSRVFEHIGRMAGVGLMAGLIAYTPAVERAGLALAGKAIPAVEVPVPGFEVRPPKVEGLRPLVLPTVLAAPVAEGATPKLAMELPKVGALPSAPRLETYVQAPERRAITVNLTLNVQAGEGREEFVERLREAAVEAVLMALERAALEEGA